MQPNQQTPCTPVSKIKISWYFSYCGVSKRQDYPSCGARQQGVIYLYIRPIIANITLSWAIPKDCINQ